MIDVIATAQQALDVDMKGATTVVIDVLRATSSMTCAIHNGARSIVAVNTPEEAFDFKAKSSSRVILGGERHADKISGFDLDNSPLSYSADVVRGNDIVMTTTNGTLAIGACRRADRLLISSFLNADNVINQLQSVSGDIYIVCAGTEGRFTIEDGLCAGYIVSKLVGDKSDFAISMQQVYLSSSEDIRLVASKGEHFERLKRKGYAFDLDVCFSDIRNYEALECVDGVIKKL